MRYVEPSSVITQIMEIKGISPDDLDEHDHKELRLATYDYVLMTERAILDENVINWVAAENVFRNRLYRICEEILNRREESDENKTQGTN